MGLGMQELLPPDTFELFTGVAMDGDRLPCTAIGAEHEEDSAEGATFAGATVDEPVDVVVAVPPADPNGSDARSERCPT